MKLILSNCFQDSYFIQRMYKLQPQLRHQIMGLQGYIPFNIAKGWVNNNSIDNLFAYPQLTKFFETYPLQLQQQILVDFGNTHLEPADYYNQHSKMILKALATRDNCYFEVSDDNFIKYLINNYPQIKIILHQNFTMYNTEDTINALIEMYPKNIVGIVITPCNLCTNINNITKYYLLSVKRCFECLHQKFCIDKDQLFTLEFSEKSAFFNCSNMAYYSENDINFILELIENNHEADYVICDYYNSNLDNLLIEQTILEKALIGGTK